MYMGFASMYDELMDNIPYDTWGNYIVKELQHHIPPGGIVVDLACGTGTITTLLAAHGYDMIGVDQSVDMLGQAQQKAFEGGQQILFLAQDMTQLDLFGSVDGVVSVCDGFNYLLDPKQLAQVFEKVKYFLNPGGVFIFDMVTEYKFKELLGQQSFEDNTKDGGGYQLDNHYNPDTGINEYRVLFKNASMEDEFLEVHQQKFYPHNHIMNALEQAGFSHIQGFHEYTHEPPRPDSPRITYIAKKI